MYIVKIDYVLKCFLSLLLDHSLFNLLLHWSMMGNWIFQNQNYFHSMFVSWKSCHCLFNLFTTLLKQGHIY